MHNLFAVGHHNDGHQSKHTSFGTIQRLSQRGKRLPDQKVEKNHSGNSKENETSMKTELNQFQISTLRLPIFCKTNKPFMYIKVMNFSEKYRVSINSEFLKNYELNFKILRDSSLTNFLKNLKSNQKHILKYPLTAPISDENQITKNGKKEFTEPKDMARIYLKLPNKNTFQVQKFTIVLENDYAPGKTIIDKYEFMLEDNKRTSVYMIDRIYGEEVNSSITFISEGFPGPNGFSDFLEAYSKLF